MYVRLAVDGPRHVIQTLVDPMHSDRIEYGYGIGGPSGRQ